METRSVLQKLLQSICAYAEAGLGLFYPEVCQVCTAERATAPQGYVCTECRKKIKFLEPPFCSRCGSPAHGTITVEYICGDCQETDLNFTTARAAVVVDPMMLDIIHRYKYNRALYFEPFLAELLITGAKPVLAMSAWDWIIPVPLHSVKRREREFNQAENLARRLGKATGLEVRTDIVQRVIATPTQTRLNRKERAENVRNAFALSPGAELKGKRVVLVDDILTTCATTNACAGALRQAGAKEIAVWALARRVFSV